MILWEKTSLVNLSLVFLCYCNSLEYVRRYVISLKIAKWTILTCISGNIRNSLELKCGRPQFQDCGLQNPLLLSSSLQRKVTVVILVYLCAKRWFKIYACFQFLPSPHALSHWIQELFPVCRSPVDIRRRVVQTLGTSIWPLLFFSFFFSLPPCQSAE